MSKKLHKSPLKTAFNPVAKTGKATAKFLWFCSKALGSLIAVCASVSALTLIADQDWTSQSMEDYAQENGIDDAALAEIEEDDIRVYQKTNPLSYFHLPGYAIYSTLRDLQNIEGYADIDGDYKSSTVEKYASSALAIGIGYPFFLYQSYSAAISSVFSSAVAFSLPDNYNDSGTCHIMPPGEIDAIELVSSMTDLPDEYITSAGFTHQEINEFIILHEARHCDGYAEARSDIYALENISISDDRRAEMADTIKYIRAVSTFSRKGIISPHEDTVHATALFIDNWQNGDYLPMTSDVEQATEKLYGLIGERAETFPEAEYPIHVYTIMQDLLKSGQLDHDIYMKRSAQLYVDGIEHLAPRAPGVQNNIQNKQNTAPYRIANLKVNFSM